jgi:hypothetical protein
MPAREAPGGPPAGPADGPVAQAQAAGLRRRPACASPPVSTRPRRSPAGYAIEMGHWDADAEHWEGEWRHVVEEDGETPAAVTDADPVAWADLPDLDPELAAKLFPDHEAEAAA